MRIKSVITLWSYYAIDKFLHECALKSFLCLALWFIRKCKQTTPETKRGALFIKSGGFIGNPILRHNNVRNVLDFAICVVRRIFWGLLGKILINIDTIEWKKFFPISLGLLQGRPPGPFSPQGPWESSLKSVNMFHKLRYYLYLGKWTYLCRFLQNIILPSNKWLLIK